MTELVLTDQQAELLSRSEGLVRLCDAAGNVLGFVSPDETAADRQYVEALGSSDAGRPDRVARLIQEGMESGEAQPVSKDWWKAKRDELARQIGLEEAP